MKLKRFYSNPSRFDVNFERGLNLICADIKEKDNKKSTRNGAGKSTFLKLIDFCLLSELEDRFDKSKEFQEYEFILELENNENKTIEIRRSIKDSTKISLSIQDQEKKILSIEDARKLFNKLFFGLPEDETTLSFRTLMNFVKRGEERGFSRIFYPFPMWDIYLKNAVNLFLIGLDYKLPIEKQMLNKEKESIDKTIFGLKKSLSDKEVSPKAVLKSQKVLLEDQIENRQKFLKDFKVHREYEKLEKDANQLRKNIRDLQNQFFVNNTKLSEYSEALVEEVNFNLSEIQDFYNSLKINFSENLKKEYSEITDFHKNLIENRKIYLSEEVERLNALNKSIKVEIEKLDSKKSEILNVLETHGALSEYQAILNMLDDEKKELYNISNYIKSYEEILDYQKKKKAFIEKIKENNEASEKEMNENEDKVKEIIIKFEEIYKTLLDVTGLLVVGIKDKYNSTEQVFEFEVKGDKKGSPGIARSQIFCYDLSIILINLAHKRTFPRFIIHDGIFNGVDRNQIENAMNFVIDKSVEKDFQEIVTINTCDMPEEIDYDKYCRLKLSDKENLMGFKF